MDRDERELLDALVRDIVGAAYEVSNVLGAGFLEKVYHHALARELASRGIPSRTRVLFHVLYKGDSVGEYVADLIVADRVVVELKCVESFSSEHLAQCINYLKISGLRLALLINFQKPKVEWRRVFYG